MFEAAHSLSSPRRASPGYATVSVIELLGRVVGLQCRLCPMRKRCGAFFRATSDTAINQRRTGCIRVIVGDYRRRVDINTTALTPSSIAGKSRSMPSIDVTQ